MHLHIIFVLFNKLFDEKIFFSNPGLGTGLGFFGSRDRSRFSGPIPGLGTRVSGFLSPGEALVGRSVGRVPDSCVIMTMTGT